MVFLGHNVQTFRGQENYTLSKELPVWDEIITTDLLHIAVIMVIIMTVILLPLPPPPPPQEQSDDNSDKQ